MNSEGRDLVAVLLRTDLAVVTRREPAVVKPLSYAGELVFNMLDKVM